MSYTDDDLEAAEKAVRDHGDWSAKWAPDAPRCIADDVLTAVAPAIAARALREFATHIQFAERPMPPDIGHVAMEAHARADEIEAQS